MKLLTVAIPCYNSESYMEHCINTLLTGGEEVEIIIVDDGSAPLERFVLYSQFAAPVAAASFSMAQAMGGDGDLASEMVVVSSCVSVFTIFMWIFVTKLLGII